MKWKRTVVWPVVAPLLALLLLGGCSGDDPQPKFEPTPSSTPTSASGDPTQSPTGPVEPTLPADAHGSGEQAARAFVAHWLATFNYAMLSGDSRALRAISSPDCRTCERLSRAVDDIYGLGGTVTGGTWTSKSLRALPLDRGADWAGYLVARISAQAVRGVQGRKDAFFDAGPGYMYVYAARQSGQWQVIFMDIPL